MDSTPPSGSHRARALEPAPSGRCSTRHFEQLRPELGGVDATIDADDERFAAETLDRYAFRGGRPTERIRAVAAGIAWERVVITVSERLAGEHDDLELLTTRWAPAGRHVDLDVIVRDQAKLIVWVLDAKNAAANHEQAGTMRHQLAVAAEHGWAPEGWTIMGVIVHPSRRLGRGSGAGARQTEQGDVIRCALAEIPDLLLAATLPDERVAARDRP